MSTVLADIAPFIAIVIIAALALSDAADALRASSFLGKAGGMNAADALRAARNGRQRP